MYAKKFSNVVSARKIEIPKSYWDDNKKNGIEITTYEIDMFKKEIEEYRKANKITYGKYRNIMTSVNVFTERMVKYKQLKGEIEQVVLRESIIQGNTMLETNIETVRFSVKKQDLAELFRELYKEVSIHTFRVYLYNIKFMLDKILERRGDAEVEEYFGSKVFKPENYILSQSTSRGTDAQNYEVFDKKKFVTLNNIKDALEYLAIVKKNLEEEKIKISRGKYDKVKLATLLFIFTGARGTEIANLQLSDVNLKRGYFILYRNKIKKPNANATVFPIHPYLKEAIKQHIKNYELKEKDNLLGEWKYLDKIIKHYYTPKRILKTNREYITLNRRKYNVEKAVITTRMFRKFFENYSEGKMNPRYKNYLLGRYVGVDMSNYVSVVHNKRVFNTLKKEYMKVFSDLPKKLEKHLKRI